MNTHTEDSLAGCARIVPPQCFYVCVCVNVPAWNHVQNIRFRRVILQVRDPLTQIAERGVSTLHPYVEGHVDDDTPMPRPSSPTNRLLRALRHYVVWHEAVLAVADDVLRVDDVNMPQFCERLAAATPAFAGKCPKTTEDAEAAQDRWLDLVSHYSKKTTFPRTSWAELRKVHAGYAARAEAIATALGYCVTAGPEDSDTMFVDAYDSHVQALEDKKPMHMQNVQPVQAKKVNSGLFVCLLVCLLACLLVCLFLGFLVPWFLGSLVPWFLGLLATGCRVPHRFPSV